MPPARAQLITPPRPEVDLDQYIQLLFPIQDEDINYEDAYEALYMLYTNPLDINHASRAQLQSLFILSEIQINNLLAYRERFGKLLELYELQAVEGWDLESIYKILPFITVQQVALNADNRSLWQKIREEENNFLITRYERILQTKRGYLPPQDSTDTRQRYLGSPDKIYTRFRVSHIRDFSMGFTAEKDAGEPIAWRPRERLYGADFWSFHAAIYNRGRLKSLILGDYQLQVGQGLLLAAGFVVGKGAETVNTVRRSTLGIRPYTSVLESGFMRGVAATYQFGKIDLTAFSSFARRDGSVRIGSDTLTDEQFAFTNSIVNTGLHRTPNELSRKNQIGERTLGIHAVYRNSRNTFELGSVLMHTQLTVPLQPIDRIYNRFEFSGNSNWNAGVHTNYQWQNFNFFGEAALSASGGKGIVAGMVSSLSARTEASVLFRNYDRNFHSFYGAAFSENTRAINERGFYWGLKTRLHQRWQWSVYYDAFRFPWLKFLVDAPSGGYETLSRLSWRPSKTIQAYIQIREERKGRNLRDNDTRLDVVVPSRRRNLQLNADIKADKNLFLRSRVQWSSYYQEGGRAPTYGFAIVQDAIFDLGFCKLSSRFALFQADDFENRQYVFEKDVLYAFSIPAYFGRGFRSYYMAQWKLGRKTSCWLRYASTRFNDRNSIGSGLERIDGNFRSEIKAQLMHRF